jgi:hypothetical protein
VIPRGVASKQLKSKFAPKSQPIFFAFFRCKSELFHRSKSKKASLSASFLIVLAEK